jgi:hypothetical protein
VEESQHTVHGTAWIAVMREMYNMGPLKSLSTMLETLDARKQHLAVSWLPLFVRLDLRSRMIAKLLYFISFH